MREHAQGQIFARFGKKEFIFSFFLKNKGLRHLTLTAYKANSLITRLVWDGSINGANHNFPLLLPLSIQNIWASIQNVWCAPPIEYFILLLSLIHFVWGLLQLWGFPYEIHGPRISHTFCMGISLLHFVWGFLSYILYGDYFHSWS